MKGVRVRTLLEKHAQPREPGMVVQLVPIDPKRPGIRSGERFDGSMRVSCVGRARNREVIELAGETLEDAGRSVDRQMVICDDAVAELGDVPNRLLEEDIFVADENHADDEHAHISSLTDAPRERSPASAPIAVTMKSG